MKDSGIPWLGQIPEHWETKRLGILYTQRNEKVSDKDFPPLSVTMKGILPQLETAAKTNDGDNRKLVRKGDFAINSRSDRRGSCGISSLDGSVSLINTVLFPHEDMSASYYNWLFHTSLFADEFYRWGHGIVDDLWTTRWSEMKNIHVPYLPLPEQKAIAEYLDGKCAEIDELIGVEERMMAELQAYKQSLITETVTKGLNPAAPLKDSGIPLVGQIPSNWNTVAIKNTAKGRNTSFVDGDWIESDVIEEEGIRYLTTGNVGAGEYKEQGAGYISETTFQKLNCTEVFAGDLLISRLNEPIGRTCIVPDLGVRMIVAVDVVIYRPNEELYDKRFVVYFMNCVPYAENAKTLSRGSTMQRISRTTLGAIKIAVPPLPEQKAIAEYLDGKCAEIDALAEVKRRKTEELKEYKKSLVYEYVTGKRETA